MNGNWLWTPLPQRLVNALTFLAYGSAAAFTTTATGGVVYFFGRKSQNLPQGYGAGIFYAALASLIVFILIRSSKRILHNLALNKLLQKHFPPNHKAVSSHPRFEMFWFVWLGLLILLGLIANTIYPLLKDQFGFAVPKPHSPGWHAYQMGYSLDSRSDELPWWHPHKTRYLTTYILGVYSITWIIFVRFLERPAGRVKQRNEHAATFWWNRDARVPGAILLLTMMSGACLIWFVDLVEWNQQPSWPPDETPKTIAGSILFLYVTLTIRLVNRLSRIKPRDSQKDISPEFFSSKPKTPGGLWDRDLDVMTSSDA